MNRVQTIQKLAEDVGIDPSSIQAMLKNGELTKYRKPGLKRVFVDPDEFYSRVEKDSDDNVSIDFDMEHFKVS